MNFKKFIPSAALVIGLVGLDQLPAQAQAKGILFKAQIPGTNYCHLKFPAIREETLGARPVLKGPNEDIIDFYGSCNYDPTGDEAVREQKMVVRRERQEEARD